MTLKEKFENIDIVAYDSIDGQYYSNLNEEEIEVIIKIADDFAIGFAMHISTHCNCELGNDARSYEELLEIYKKEKGL